MLSVLWVPGPAGHTSPLCPTSRTTWQGGVSTPIVEMETLRPMQREGRRQPRVPGAGGEEAASCFLHVSQTPPTWQGGHRDEAEGALAGPCSRDTLNPSRSSF